ncbi:hypothetical protein ACQVP2_21750 [Methylobacterium aquaticum]|uniref:hypothetical protein n=1 Tax=Methylobacterium aquaticum TaxID=270351 RepID=UPI003D17E550
MPGDGLAAFARLAAERGGRRLAAVPRFDAAAVLRSGAMIGAEAAGMVERRTPSPGRWRHVLAVCRVKG